MDLLCLAGVLVVTLCEGDQGLCGGREEGEEGWEEDWEEVHPGGAGVVLEVASLLPGWAEEVAEVEVQPGNHGSLRRGSP